MTSVTKVFFSKRMLIIFLMGLSSGIPLLITGSTLQAWLKGAGVDLTVIGIFALVGLPYTLKFVWAPLMDRYVPMKLGRRRGWAALSQIGLVLSISALAFTDPVKAPWIVALLALVVSFFSASQDIALDAYRREALPDNELGLGSSLFVNGYRIGMLLSGAFALFLADQIPWKMVYLILASTMLLGLFVTWMADEPARDVAPPRTLKEAVVEPFLEYFKRRGALEILVFILLYKIGDAMASAMTTPFILDIGFTKTDIATIAKTFGMIATIVGALIGGLAMVRLGIKRSLWVFGILQAVSTLGFALLASAGLNYPVLASVIAFENLTSGMGTSVYVAFMATLTNKRFTATQYALLSSLMGIPRVLASAPTGWMAKNFGWETFFLVCTAAAIPGLLMLLRYRTWQEPPSTDGLPVQTA